MPVEQRARARRRGRARSLGSSPRTVLGRVSGPFGPARPAYTPRVTPTLRGPHHARRGGAHRRRPGERALLRRGPGGGRGLHRPHAGDRGGGRARAWSTSAPWPGFVAQRNHAAAAARARLGAGRGRGRARDPRAARRDRGRCARRASARRLPHPARRLLPRALDPRHRLVSRSAAPPLRPPPRALAGRARPRVGARGRAAWAACATSSSTTPTTTSPTTCAAIDRYTTLWARQAHAEGRRAGPLDALRGLVVGLRPQLRPAPRVPARRGGPHRLRAQRVLHLREAGQAAERARTAATPREGRCTWTPRARLARRPEPGAADARAGMARARARGRAGLPARRARSETRAAAGGPRRAPPCRSAATCRRARRWGLARLVRAIRPRRGPRSTIRTPLAAAAPASRARAARWPPGAWTSRCAAPLSRWKYGALPARDRGEPRGGATCSAADGVPAARVRVVYEGVPDRPPAPGGRDALAALGVPARRAGGRQRGRAHRPQGPRDAARPRRRCVRRARAARRGS